MIFLPYYSALRLNIYYLYGIEPVREED